MYNFQVNTFYKSDGTSFDKDDVAMDAVGRDAEESGWGCGERDLGWLCETKDEAEQVKLALESIGMIADITELQQ